MNRPYIFCHMITSIDGKIDGTHKQIPERGLNAKDFYHIAFGENSYYQVDAWLSGRATSEAGFTKGKTPSVDENAALVPEGDYIAETDLSKYYVSVDPSGKLGWESSNLQYRDTQAHIIEVLTEKANNGYKALLRELNISYIIAGKETLDYELLMEKLKNTFHIETLMLGGGGVLNWSFIQAGLCDEVSILMAPFADGSASTHALFQTKEGLSEDIPVTFDLEHVEKRDNGGVWLRYKVKK
ncbi:RibD family protein [Oceanobacillus neutriphilus]|uniref:5-amino-6-(5-phosphoribosylamino)uracil reductase n=1 Tax=Oceanobacillus neutriphilus TaxID=531815 RepID=A0ABQ2NU92_9BACI|nr:RibD family protein [Oceanobacillus neutriphilus]GGP10721.1 5-amino-6-(5-phosphoribosylamino)uracil reductase [Oceanobacillus neutriphilus]